MADISQSGVFFDTKANKVVNSQPEEGVQIVAPGGELTATAEAEIARWREVESGNPQPVAEAVTTEAAGSGETADKPSRSTRSNK